MHSEELDPAYRRAVREAVVITVVFVCALAYTILYCWFTGYDRDPATITLYAGIPDWVFWGVFVPWTIGVLVTVWFCFFFTTEDDLDPPPPADAMAEYATDPDAVDEARDAS